MAKNLTQVFSGVFFLLSLIYFAVMFFALKDSKAYVTKSVYSTNEFGETNVVSKGEDVLLPV
jgi:hypothetical protein